MGFVLDRDVVLSRFEEAAGRVLERGVEPCGDVRAGVVQVAAEVLDGMGMGWGVDAGSWSVSVDVGGRVVTGHVYVLPKGAEELDVAGRVGVVWFVGDDSRVRSLSGECLGVVGSGVALANAVCGVVVEGCVGDGFVGMSPEFSAHLVYEG